MASSATAAANLDWRNFRVVKIEGQSDTHIETGEDYETVTLSELFGFEPTNRVKKRGTAFIPSSYSDYDARVHERQRESGSYVALCGDIDKGDHDGDKVAGVVAQIVEGAAWFMHTTSNSCPGNMRWRIIIPLAEPATFLDWRDAQLAFFAIMERAGFVMDKAVARAGQLNYLPNIPATHKDGETKLRGDDGEPLYYRSISDTDGKPGLSLSSRRMARAIDAIRGMRAQKEREDQEKREAAMRKSVILSDGQDEDVMAAFNRLNPLESMLAACGYKQDPTSKIDWKSIYQEGDTYATRVMDNGRWVSLSQSDCSQNIGHPCDSGCYGDSYDLYVHYKHGGNHRAAHRVIHEQRRAEQVSSSPNVVPWPKDAHIDYEFINNWEPVPAWDVGDEELVDTVPDYVDGNTAADEVPDADAMSSELPLQLISPATWSGTTPPDRDWRWLGFIPNHQATLLTGAGATGKSLLSQQMATCIGMGLPILGVQVAESPSLYITCEDDADELHRRQFSICQHLGVSLESTLERLYLLSLYGELGNELCTFADDDTIVVSDRYAAIVSTCQHLGIRHVVLDNTAHLFTGDENKRSHVTSFLNLCNRMAREIDGSVVIVGHPNKAGDSYSGSTAWENNVRSRIFMSRVLDDNGVAMDPDARVLRNEKANYSRQGNQIDFRWYNGAFALGSDMAKNDRDNLAENILAATENDAFLRCLDILTEQKRKVSASVNGNYAPRLMARMPEGNGFKVKQFEVAMERLFSSGRIVAEADLWMGDDRKMVKGLARK
jgi:RecA-family ATPase